MKRRVLWIAAAAAASVALLSLLVVMALRTPARKAAETPTMTPVVPTPAPEQRVILLFAGVDDLLHPELRSVPYPAEVGERARIVVSELAAGPRGGLHPVFPYSVQVRGVFVDGRGQAFVDLDPPSEPLTGSSTELLMTYAVVNSILLNCPELDTVQLLFGGREVKTLAGHLDLSRPLSLNKGFIATS